KPADAASALVEVAAFAELRRQIDEIDRRPREHHPALAVERPDHHVERVDEPAVEAPEALDADADAPVGDPALGARELAREATDGGRLDAGGRGHRLGGERPHGPAELLEAARELGEATRANAIFVVEGVDQRGEEEAVAPGADEVVLV